MVRICGGGYAGGHVPHISLTTFARKARASARVKKLPPQQQAYIRLVKRARSTRQRTRKDPYMVSTIKTLPRDSLVEVAATVASHSFIDLHAMKICCKDFLDATEDNYVWQKVSLDTFPLIQWLPNDKATSFLNRCRECGNTESLFREGLRKYFYFPNDKIEALEILKVAAEKGHNEAKYVCGMISLYSKDEELQKQGLNYMRLLRKSKCVVGSRKKVKRLLDNIWKTSGILWRNQKPLCNFKSTCKGWRVKTGRWALLDDDDDDNDDINSCECCRWDHEFEIFYRLFNFH